MKEPQNADVTMICARFEAAWQQALQGQPPPSIDVCVDAAPEGERGLLRQELQKLESEYRQRLGQVAGPAAAPGSAGASTESGPADGQTALPADADMGPTIPLSADERQDQAERPLDAKGK